MKRLSHRRHHRAHGFSLIELLLVLGLMGVVGLMGGKLFIATINLGRAAAEAQNGAAGMDAAASVLRADAWAANRMDVSAGQKVTLESPDAPSVVWSITPGDGGGKLTRQQEGQPTRSWPVPDGSTFATDDASLVLQIAASKNSHGGTLRFVNEVQLLAKLSS